MLHRRGVKDFIYMLTEKYNYEMTYAKGMKKIYDSNYAVSTMNTLQSGILAFKNDLLNQYNYTVEFLNSLNEEVIDPLKGILNFHNSEGKRLNTEMLKVDRAYKDSVDSLEKVSM
jgi:hypothetical protein